MSTDINISKNYERYDSTTWVNEETLINQERLNKIETAIKQLQRGESILVGTVSSERLQVANALSSTSSTVLTPSAMGAIQIYSGGSSGYPKLGQGEPNLVRGFCVSPKLLNDLYLNSAEPTAIDGTRIAKKSAIATSLEKSVKIRLNGGVSSDLITFQTGNDTAISFNVNVLGDQHTHNLAQLVDCDANLTRSGLTQVVADYSAISGQTYAKETNKVPNAYLFKTITNKYDSDIAGLKLADSNLFGSISSIKSLSGDELNNTPLKAMYNNVNNLVTWKNTVSNVTIPGINSKVEEHELKLVNLNNVTSEYLGTWLPKIKTIDSIRTIATNNLESIKILQSGLENLNNTTTTLNSKILQNSNKITALEETVSQIPLIREAINLLAERIRYSGDVWADAEAALGRG